MGLDLGKWNDHYRGKGVLYPRCPNCFQVLVKLYSNSLLAL